MGDEIDISLKNQILYLKDLNEVYNLWIEEIMDNYNLSFYYETPEYHLA
nr:hypothetical protein [Clostridium neonatale]